MACEDYRRRTRHAALQEEMRRPQPRNPANEDSGDDEDEDGSEDGAEVVGAFDEIRDDEDSEGNKERDSEDDEDESPSLHPLFFTLTAMDIDKNEISFSDFRGKITVITNVASECGESFPINYFLTYCTILLGLQGGHRVDVMGRVHLRFIRAYPLPKS